MPPLRDFLGRFRLAGAPGAAGRAGVPADRARDLEAELVPVLELLAEADAEGARLVEQARADAERIVAAARDQAAAQLREAGQRAAAAREDTVRQIVSAAQAEAAAAVARARQQATRERQLAAQRIPALAARAVGLVRDLAGAGGEAGT